MDIPIVKLTCDAGDLLSELEFLKGFPEFIKSHFGSFDGLIEFIGIQFEVESTLGACECRAFLKVSDSFRDFMSALKAGDIN